MSPFTLETIAISETYCKLMTFPETEVINSNPKTYNWVWTKYQYRFHTELSFSGNLNSLFPYYIIEKFTYDVDLGFN